MVDLPPKRIAITKDEVVTPPAAQLSQQSFVQRTLEFAITLAPDQKTNQPIKFAGTDQNTVSLSGHRASVRIQNSGAPAGSHASIRIYGLTESLMNQLATLGIVFNSIQKNAVAISAGDAVNGLTPVFAGTINYAYPNYNEAPIVPMVLECQTGLINQVLPVAASSFPKSTDVGTILSGMARQMNVGFENNGVSVQMPPSYFRGDLMTQIKAVAQYAHINAELVDGGAKLAIWPIGGSRTSLAGQSIPLISAKTGMIGYPTFAPNGYMIVRSLFIPQVSFGGTIRVESRIPQANRTWVVQKLDLALDSLVPKGQWMMTLHCYPLGFAAPPPPSGSAP